MGVKSVNCDGSAFSQTRFLGATIVSFTTNIGWNEASSQLTVRVVEDTCVTPKVDYDTFGNVSINSTADSFVPPPTGWPIYFQYGNFVFTGVMNNWKETLNTSGKTYTVSCSDPRIITQGCNVVLSGYNGPTFEVPNLVNPYGFSENYEQVLGGACTIPANIQSWMGYTASSGFGGAQNNETGVPWNIIWRALNNQLNLPLGDLISSSYGGPRLNFKGVEYAVDLLSLPIMPEWFRIDSDKLDLNSLVSRVCKAAGFDYIVTLVPVAATGQFIIKYLTAARSQQLPNAELVDINTGLDITNRLALGTVTSAIGTGFSPVLNQWVEGYERGLELNEPGATPPSNSMTVGEARHDVLQATQDMIAPFWGYDRNNNVLQGSGVDDFHFVTVDAISWNLGISSYPLYVAEVRAALGGQQEWETYLTVVEPAKAASLGLGDSLLDLTGFQGTQLGAGSGTPLDGSATQFNQALFAANEHANCNGNLAPADFRKLVFEQVANLATQFFGKKFQVDVSSIICHNREVETGEIRTNFNIATGGAWPETNILGLAQDGLALQFFRNEEGLLQCMVVFENANLLDFSAISPDDIWYEGGFAWVKADVEEKFSYSDFANRVGARAIISLPAPVFARNCVYDPYSHIYGLLGHISRLGYGASPGQLLNTVASVRKPGATANTYNIGPMAVLPFGCALPFRSNNLSYGPWVATAAGQSLYSVFGASEYTRDTRFKPWAFGSSSLMGQAALLEAQTKIGFTHVDELGEIRAVGAPLASVGQALISGGPYITAVDMSIGIQGVKTNYRFRTYAPKFGEAIKQRLDLIERQGYQQQRIAYGLARNIISSSRSLAQNQLMSSVRRTLFRSKRTKPASPHHLLVGYGVADATGTQARQHVMSGEIAQEVGNLANYWTNSAGNSMEGVFRPFSTTGANSSLIPAFTTPVRNLNYGRAPVGPVLSSGAEVQYIPITSITLNPYQNSGGGYGFFNFSNGHDIEYVVRDGVYPVSLSVRQPNDNYGSDYRAMGFRGPMVMAGWGFDTNGRPVPNLNPSNPGNTFASNWLRRPDLWKVGPIDLRWDDDRGVWVGPQPYKPSFAYTCVSIGKGQTGYVELTLDDNQRDEFGNIAISQCGSSLSTNVVEATNYTGFDLRGEWPCWVVFNQNTEEYNIFSSVQPLCQVYYTLSDADCAEGGAGTCTLEDTLGVTSLTGDYSDIAVTLDNPLKAPTNGGYLITTPTSIIGTSETHTVVACEFQNKTFVTDVQCNDDGSLCVNTQEIRFMGAACDEQECSVGDEPNE